MNTRESNRITNMPSKIQGDSSAPSNSFPWSELFNDFFLLPVHNSNTSTQNSSSSIVFLQCACPYPRLTLPLYVTFDVVTLNYVVYFSCASPSSTLPLFLLLSPTLNMHFSPSPLRTNSIFIFNKITFLRFPPDEIYSFLLWPLDLTFPVS